MVAFDNTPIYIADADRVPAMAMCVTPWPKLVLLLRNPVQRTISHYEFLNDARVRKNKTIADWRLWVDDDFRLLREAGVIANRTKKEAKEFAGSREEAEAWKKYNRSPGSTYLLGRSLYSIQLRLWLAEMKKNQKPFSDLFVVQSEKIRNNTQLEFNRIMSFLGLEEYDLLSSEPKHETKKSGVQIPDDVRQQLEEFFAPYNEELYDLLGPEWKNAW
eukprot:CAMPEP_0116540614 /NCGR_PEP_ID=MMETSP0397-20121206/46_1 /TAXON_ID=216820 /ORGANISM="Cyclophora tenuis, Strain ECT3854" /LENGTH=216 /DNA_ID=CAMNT_0004064507 /DNA_START=78 /DNA_END=725 /DNA_ORIENTATION=+